MKTFNADGRTFQLIPADRFRSLDEDQARAFLRDALDEGGGHLLHRLADACGVEPSDRKQVIERMAREIARGNYLLYATDVERGLDPSIGAEELPWDDLPSLADLRVDEPDVDERPTVATTWLSFEIVDDHGVPADGDFACNIDGSDHAGELADGHQYFDKVRFGARARLRAHICFDSARPGPRGPTPDPQDPVDPRADDPLAPNELTFEVVDDAGHSLAGRYAIDDGSGPRGGAFQGRARLSAVSAPRVAIHVDWPSSVAARVG